LGRDLGFSRFWHSTGGLVSSFYLGKIKALARVLTGPINLQIRKGITEGGKKTRPRRDLRGGFKVPWENPQGNFHFWTLI